MVLNFNYPLQQALQHIKQEKYHSFIIHPQEQKAPTSQEDKQEKKQENNQENKQQHDQFIEKYADAKWGIINMLNNTYNKILHSKFDLYNWAIHNTNDEVAYFLTEAGSNCMNYAQFQAPSQFHLWCGRKGFIIGIEQKGQPFPAQLIDEKNLKQNEGAAFEFYRKCKGIVFFDNPKNSTIVYLQVMF